MEWILAVSSSRKLEKKLLHKWKHSLVIVETAFLAILVGMMLHATETGIQKGWLYSH